MAKTLFEKIIDRELPADIVHEDAMSLAFRDINPGAPVHILVIPRKPIPMLSDATDEDRELLGHLMRVGLARHKPDDGLLHEQFVLSWLVVVRSKGFCQVEIGERHVGVTELGVCETNVRRKIWSLRIDFHGLDHPGDRLVNASIQLPFVASHGFVAAR